jgi:RNA polymerase sigma-70 factor (ECF subfamily)
MQPTDALENKLADLMRRGLAGDEPAYRRLLSDAAALVRAYARRRCSGSGIDAEDIVQEALLAIHLKRHTWRADMPVTPWLYAIARYKLVDAMRRSGRRPTVDIDDVADTLAAEQAEGASAGEIDRALELLTPGQRDVVSAVSLEGHSIRETAARFNMQETAVRVALHRGLNAIAARLGRS